MRILEILLPPGADKSLSPKHIQKIDALQKRMDSYVDRIMDPKTSEKGKEFLKSKLRDDYHELKDTIAQTHEVAEAEGDKEGVPHITKELLTHIVQQIGTEGAHAIVKSLEWGDGASKELLDLIKKDLKNNISMSESVKQRLDKSCWSGYHKAGTKTKNGKRLNNCVPNESTELPPVEPIQPVETFEIVDSKTGKVIGKPYSSKSRARARVDRLDNEYGAYRYQVRRVGGSFMIESRLDEAVHKLPLTEEDFELVKTVMSRPIPAIIAPIYIQEIIDDDEFNDMLNEFAETNPGMDVRPHIVEWIKRVMPDQMYRFDHSGQTEKQKLGQTSVIHGYDPHMYHGTNEPITGDAYGRL